MNPNSSACFTVSKPGWYSAIREGAKQLILVVFSTLHTWGKWKEKCLRKNTFWDAIGDVTFKHSTYHHMVAWTPRNVFQSSRINSDSSARLRCSVFFFAGSKIKHHVSCWSAVKPSVCYILKCDLNWNTLVLTWTLQEAHQPNNRHIKSSFFSQKRIYCLSLNPSLLVRKPP